ncbi:RHS repeat domain-containing protein [Zooshikella ganghwensis]|uniref:RHS repeat domain-containing protein n=1 Tax=Zooshikella ganghwensis TaxID=202772 RepID=UPI00041C64CA|nr:RHS repeat-associated core domain-containing protein [Zooshikella ganghwensis]
MLSASGQYGKLGFSYGKTGNRLSATIDASEIQFNYIAGSQKLKEIAGETATAITHEANGNITRYGDKAFHYNSENRLVRVSQRNEVVAEYVYNPEGLRTQKITPNKTTHYLYDSAGTLLAEANSDGSIEREYISLGLDPVAFVEGSNAYYIHTGHLNQPLAVTNQHAETVWEASYKPFGEVALNQEQVTFNLRFPGQYHDAETGLYYNNQRYYSPELGRYITSDPIGLEGGINTYGYVGQNPTNAVDPTGEVVWFAIPAVLYAADMALSAYDAYETVSVLTDPCATTGEKLTAGGLFAAGLILPGNAQAYKAGGKLVEEGSTVLYRAVSKDELIDISKNGFQMGTNSMGNKWFAESAEDAASWGKKFFAWDKEPVWTLKVTLPNSTASKFMRTPRLDNIGPARSADAELLKELNENSSIKVLMGNVNPN